MLLTAIGATLRGDLQFSSNAAPAFQPPALKSISGQLLVQSNSALSTLQLDSLAVTHQSAYS
jgi:hypothetical protein